MEDLAGAWLVPGFVDIHVHGGGGASMTGGDAAQILEAAQFHRRHGTTHLLVSQVTAGLDTMLAGCAAVAGLVEGGARGIVGGHLEGPFLSRRRRGAQDPDSLLPVEPEVLERLLSAGRGTVRMVTVAPELPGAPALIARLVAEGVVAALGHTDASYAEAVAGFRAGARVATHLFNGMPPLHHRDPGPVAAALERPGVVCELINDGFHVAPAIVRLVAAAAGPDRVAFITDAIAAAGMGDGDYELGRLPVRVAGGLATLVDGGNIAGSTLTMDRAFQRAVLEVGLRMEDAVRMASTTPARVLGLEGRVGTIRPGQDADLVVLDDGLEVTAVMAAGDWVPGVNRGPVTAPTARERPGASQH
ncbi:N-acetylglucosamine-6-phosphate deacetylase [Candidatus Nephthysia bennettiae]|uniref:N-acetylglucosamine-6-phosphate deacetylase n=1 Tax=Candidatus Nephthysia bennettiae TaxID=3127016 RepID=UPI0030C7571C